MIYDLCDFCRLVMLARWFTKQYRERPDLVKVGGGVFTHKTHQLGLSVSFCPQISCITFDETSPLRALVLVPHATQQQHRCTHLDP